MPGNSIKGELQDFLQFAAQRIERGEGGESVEALVQQWRNDSEYAEAVADVCQGLVDDTNGCAESVSDAFADIRRRLGMSE